MVKGAPAHALLKPNSENEDLSQSFLDKVNKELLQ